MLGVIVTGRLPQTDFQPVSENQFVVNIPEADSINHIVVFLTGSQPFPQNMGGLVYFSWPDPNSPPSWQLLGHITNDKPSAIFKISDLKKTTGDSSTMLTFGAQKISHSAQIGISVEPIMNVQQQTVLLTSQRTSSFQQFGQKMLENFINYVMSFAVTQSQMTPNTDTYVPMSTLQGWYNNFQRRLQQNPYFWRN